MSNDTNKSGASKGHFNIPPPPLPPNMQPYGFAPYNHGSAPSYGGLVAPHQFQNNSFMPPQNQASLNSFPPPPPPSFTAPPPPPPPFTPFSSPPSSSSSSSIPHNRWPNIVHQMPTAPNEENDVDKVWIRNWLQRIGKVNKSTSRFIDYRLVSDSIQISEMKAKVLKMRKLVNELESQSKSLTVMMKSLNDEEWQIRVEEIEDKKRDLAELLNELGNKQELISGVKRQLDRRSRKRTREKKKRFERRMAEAERRMADERENERIDLWLKEMEEGVERMRREEELKREADSVLSGVTRRRNEAKRQLALLQGLRKLHKARVVAWNAMGLVISSLQLETFTNVIDRLTSMWNSRLEGYNLEERGLKVMLYEANAEDKASSANRQKLILRQWERALFGDSAANAQNATHVPQDFESFLSVRKDWDRFVVPEDSVMSSSIPVGWIIPCKPSSDGWRQLLQDRK